MRFLIKLKNFSLLAHQIRFIENFNFHSVVKADFHIIRLLKSEFLCWIIRSTHLSFPSIRPQSSKSFETFFYLLFLQIEKLRISFCSVQNLSSSKLNFENLENHQFRF